MGRFHRHPDGTIHAHEHDDDARARARPRARTRARTSETTAATSSTGPDRIAVLEDILSENDHVAAANRRDLVAAGVRSVNLMSSPGAGKTTLLKRTLTTLGPSAPHRHPRR